MRLQLARTESELRQATQQITTHSDTFKELNTLKKERLQSQTKNSYLKSQLARSETHWKTLSVQQEELMKENQDLQTNLSTTSKNLTMISAQQIQLSTEKNGLESLLKDTEKNLNLISNEKQALKEQFDLLSKEKDELFEKLKIYEDEQERKRKLESENQPLADFLNSLGFSEYFVKFQSEKFEVETLEEIQENDLKELGMNNMGDRKRFIMKVKKRKEMKKSTPIKTKKPNIEKTDLIQHFEVLPSDLIEGNQIGTGAFGDVFQVNQLFQNVV